MNNRNRITGMRVKRLAYGDYRFPLGLWTYPDPLDGPSIAPCYAPYGEQSPPIPSHPAVEEAAVESTTETDARKSEGLKPWEKGSKTGKKIKKGRGLKAHSRDDLEESVGSKEVSSSSSNTVGSGGVPAATTSTLSSLRTSPAPLALDPMLDASRRPRFRILPPSAPYVPPTDTAQAAIAESRSTSRDSVFLTLTNTRCAERKHDRVDNEAPAPSRKTHKGG
jgi:hypothetical protein